MSPFRKTLTPPVGASLRWRPMWVRRLAFCCEVVAWLVRRVYRLARFGWRHRQGVVTVVAVAALGWVMRAWNYDGRVGILWLLLLASLLWVHVQPGSDRRRLLAWWRWLTVYRWEWGPAMTLTGLSYGGRLPTLRRVEIDGALDVVHCRMLPGQVAERWHDQRDYLAQVFGAASCRVLAVGNRSPLLVLEFAIPGRARTPGNGESW